MASSAPRFPLIGVPAAGRPPEEDPCDFRVVALLHSSARPYVERMMVQSGLTQSHLLRLILEGAVEQFIKNGTLPQRLIQNPAPTPMVAAPTMAPPPRPPEPPKPAKPSTWDAVAKWRK